MTNDIYIDGDIATNRRQVEDRRAETPRSRHARGQSVRWGRIGPAAEANERADRGEAGEKKRRVADDERPSFFRRGRGAPGPPSSNPTPGPAPVPSTS